MTKGSNSEFYQNRLFSWFGVFLVCSTWWWKNWGHMTPNFRDIDISKGSNSRNFIIIPWQKEATLPVTLSQSPISLEVTCVHCSLIQPIRARLSAAHFYNWRSINHCTRIDTENAEIRWCGVLWLCGMCMCAYVCVGVCVGVSMHVCI